MTVRGKDCFILVFSFLFTKVDIYNTLSHVFLHGNTIYSNTSKLMCHLNWSLASKRCSVTLPTFYMAYVFHPWGIWEGKCQNIFWNAYILKLKIAQSTIFGLGSDVGYRWRIPCWTIRCFLRNKIFCGKFKYLTYITG